ncbi:MAG: SEC-C domain-containing protein [Deltaproteobacteria bacterium]|jgi:hypothetical protein|nr:MAG: SEC-C domain-containing protein [Deltaproteobacteria bacterium]
MKFQILPKDKCPCGSGNEYRKCHSPKRDRSDNNMWKGPGYKQVIYFGDKKTVSGFHFDKAKRGEFKLLRDDDRIPLPRFFCVDDSILECKAIVRYLSISVENNTIKFVGSVGINCNLQSEIPILIGCSDINSIKKFEANFAGKPISYERGVWSIYIGEDENPIARIKKQPQWFRYLYASGYLVEAEATGEINFSLYANIKGFNLFTLAMPFGEIEIPHPQISVLDHQTTCQFEIEKERVSWDLILHQDIFSEKKRARKDSRLFLGFKKDEGVDFEDFDESVRKHFLNPIKLRIGVSTPDLSTIIGKFNEILDRTIRTISEDGGFLFEETSNRILEADFRDYVLTVLKSSGYYAIAEPSRRGGFIDILLKKGESESIIEFKVWGRRKYKEVIKQVLDYGTPWTTEYATVIINPNKGSILDKFVDNARKAPGFKYISDENQDPTALQKLTSSHYLTKWDRHIVVSHLIINTTML